MQEMSGSKLSHKMCKGTWISLHFHLLLVWAVNQSFSVQSYSWSHLQTFQELPNHPSSGRQVSCWCLVGSGNILIGFSSIIVEFQHYPLYSHYLPPSLWLVWPFPVLFFWSPFPLVFFHLLLSWVYFFFDTIFWILFLKSSFGMVLLVVMIYMALNMSIAIWPLAIFTKKTLAQPLFIKGNYQHA